MEWTDDDVRGAVRVLDGWWALLSEGLDAELLASSSSSGALTVSELRSAATARVADAGDRGSLEAAVESALESLSQAGRTLHELGAGVAPMRGRVEGVFASDGGVPKLPVDAAVVGERGLVGDRQRDRRNHGRPWQALCLWSAEVIAALQAEGHPVAPGCAGENLTLGGLQWELLRPCTRLRLGSVLAELSLPASPCRDNARWFVDGRFTRISHARHPGSSRWYARVLEPGSVRVGDVVLVEP